MTDAISVAVSLDVEEEGLFRGRYACRNVSIANAAALIHLEQFIRRGVRPTLFCAYPVLTNTEACGHLARLLPNVEIGAHLHHWNTPPLVAEAEKSAFLFSVPSRVVPLDLFDEKLRNTLAAGENFCGRPLTSFRMGRWDIHGYMFPILAKNGITVDASVRPFHNLLPLGPDHFHAPRDPYLVHTDYGDILEVPLTVSPLTNAFSKLPAPLTGSLRHWGCLALLPVEHPLWLMRLTTSLHIRRGGRVISLAWHSSEMYPGGNPRLASQADIDAFLIKISCYLDWLENNFNIAYVNMTQLPSSHKYAKYARGYGDWTCGAQAHA